MRIHRHDPVRRIDPIVAAIAADVGVARKDRAVQHQHVVAEHLHASVHRRRIGNPARARTFATHRIGKVDRRMHFHFMHHVIVLAVMLWWCFPGGRFDRNRPSGCDVCRCGRFFGEPLLLARH